MAKINKQVQAILSGKGRVRKKITAEQIEEWEIESMIDALLGGAFELNDEFLDRYAGADLAALLKTVPESDRAFHLDGNIEPEEAHFNATVPGLEEAAFMLPHNEIEYQFEGTPEEAFEKPDDFHIEGDLAYLYTGYGLTIPVDMNGLRESINA